MTAIAKELAPKGHLRVALNHGNKVLVQTDDDGHPSGIAVTLARAFAEHMGLELELISFEGAGQVSSAAQDDVWDVCFLAVDPDRRATIAFTEPYVQIEGAYLAGPHCAVADAPALIASGGKVGAVHGTAYALTLSRKPGAENLVYFDDNTAALAALDRGEVDAVAHIRQVVEAEGSTRPGSRVLEPAFMEIRQAMAVPQGRPAAAQALQDFLTDRLTSGFVGDTLERFGVSRGSAILPG
ncbi:MAG: transporter substrate-binding domain-containing protein [Pseudomonadota bacterium]|nr:transporter substrate-binding domain-containing protein [Pseudomonadota bacterium]